MSAHDCPHSASDAAAYALGALEPEEAEAFLRHTESCVVCRDELLGFASVADTLALGVTQYDAPRRLRHAVMRDVRREAGLRADRLPRRGPARRLGPRPGWLRAPAWIPAPALGAGLAAVLLAVAVLGGIELGSSNARASRTISAEVFDSQARAALRISTGHAELIVEHLHQPPAGDIYEVWLKRGSSVHASSLFSPVASGRDVVEVPGDLSSVSEVMVTIEPARGVARPTTQPIIVAPTHA